MMWYTANILINSLPSPISVLSKFRDNSETTLNYVINILHPWTNSSNSITCNLSTNMSPVHFTCLNIQWSSTTTKVQIAFDGSLVKTGIGNSLNVISKGSWYKIVDCGPILQSDLVLTLMRWRAVTILVSPQI